MTGLMSEAEFLAHSVSAEWYADGEYITAMAERPRDLYADHYVSEHDAVLAYLRSDGITPSAFQRDVAGTTASQWDESISERIDYARIRSYKSRAPRTIPTGTIPAGTTMVGAMAIARTASDVIAVCTRCGKRITYGMALTITAGNEREAMELFTLAAIAHGNNEFARYRRLTARKDENGNIVRPVNNAFGIVIDEAAIIANYDKR